MVKEKIKEVVEELKKTDYKKDSDKELLLEKINSLLPDLDYKIVDKVVIFKPYDNTRIPVIDNKGNYVGIVKIDFTTTNQYILYFEDLVGMKGFATIYFWYNDSMDNRIMITDKLIDKNSIEVYVND